MGVDVALTGDDTIAKLSLPNEVYNSLVRADKRTVGDLSKLCICEVLDIPGIGWDACMTLVDTMIAHQFSLNRDCVRQRT